MGVELFAKCLLLLLISMGRWPVLALIPRGSIIGCSMSSVTFEYLELRTSNLRFRAACLSEDNGTCVYGMTDTPEVDAREQNQTNIALSSCGKNIQLLPADPGLCTLQITSTNFILNTGSTSVTVCALPSAVMNIDSTPVKTIDSSSSEHPQNSLLPGFNSTGTQHTSSPLQLGTAASIAVPLSLLILFLVIVFAVAIVSLILWTRHTQIKARRTLRIEEVVVNVSPSFLFGTGDDYIPGDTLTLYEDFDAAGDEEDMSRTDLPLQALKNEFNSSDEAMSVTDGENMKNTMQNSPPTSSLSYNYVVIRTEDKRESR